MKRQSIFRAVLALAALAIAAIALSACGSSDSSATDEGGGGETTTADTGGNTEGGQLAVLIDQTRNDKSFGQATYEGAKRAAEELGLELSVVESLEGDAQKAQAALMNFAKEADYVINGSAPLHGGLPRVAEQFPDTQFAAYAVAVDSRENLHWAFQDWYPLGYLAGIAAAEATKSNVVGFVGGGEIPPTIAGEAAFEKAVKSVDPNIRILSTITGSFEDTTKAKDAAAAQIAQGADVIYSFVDAGHLGVVQAAKEAGNVQTIGVVVPKCDFSEGVDLGDTVSRQDELVAELARQMVDGTIENTIYGVQDPKVANLEFCPEAGDPAVEKAVEEAREEFANGQLKTPPEYTQAQANEE